MEPKNKFMTFFCHSCKAWNNVRMLESMNLESNPKCAHCGKVLWEVLAYIERKGKANV